MDEQPTHLDLFSGIGGFALAAQWAGFRTIGFCEIDKYCRKVLAKNFLADTESERSEGRCLRQRGICEPGNNVYESPDSSPTGTAIFSNIFDLDGTRFRCVDLITGGFPCQPFSVAGKRGGASDDRAIWPQMFRVISEARPAWVLGENVPGIIPMELDNVLSDLEGIGYATRSFVIPACAVDAKHRRDRMWIVANSTSVRREQRSGWQLGGAEEKGRLLQSVTENSSVADNGEPVERRTAWIGRRERQHDETSRDGWGGGRQANGQWLPEPGMGRVAHGIPNRAHRLKGLGNAIVPQVAYEILREIRNLV